MNFFFWCVSRPSPEIKLTDESVLYQKIVQELK